MATYPMFSSPRALCSPKQKINLLSASPRSLCFANKLKTKPISASLCNHSFHKMKARPVSASPRALLPLSKINNHSIPTLKLNPGEPRKISVSALPSPEPHNSVDGELVDMTIMVVEEEVEGEKNPLLKYVEVWLVPKLKYAIPVLICFGVYGGTKLAVLLPRLIEYLNKNGTAITMLVSFSAWAFKSSVDAILERREMKKTTKSTRIYKRKPPADINTEGESKN